MALSGDWHPSKGASALKSPFWIFQKIQNGLFLKDALFYRQGGKIPFRQPAIRKKGKSAIDKIKKAGKSMTSGFSGG